MKKVKVTVEVIMALPPGAELLESLVADDDNYGAHIISGGKAFCPMIEWMAFEPGQSRSNGQARPINRHRSIDGHEYKRYLATDTIAAHDHRIEWMEE